MGFTLNIGQNPGRPESHGLELRLSVDPNRNIKSALTSNIGDASDLSRNSPAVSTLIVANNAKSYLDIANDAVSSISDLRKRQLELAQEAENINDVDQSTRLQTEINNISTEITRIGADATFNGENVLSGRTFTINNSPADITQRSPFREVEDGRGSQNAIGAAKLSTLTTSFSLTVTDQTSASDTVDTLEDLVRSADQAAGFTSSALGKATAILDATVHDPTKDYKAPAPKDTTEAEALVKSLVTDIRSLYNQRDSGADVLFYTLDPTRVDDLLNSP